MENKYRIVKEVTHFEDGHTETIFVAQKYHKFWLGNYWSDIREPGMYYSRVCGKTKKFVQKRLNKIISRTVNKIETTVV